jgi:hypothetical protein
MASEITSAVIQAVAGLGGVMAGLRLELWRRMREERKQRQQSFSRVLFALMLQRTFLLNFEDQHLALYRNNDCRAYMLPPLTTLPARLNVDIESLGFVLDSPEANVLNRVAELI